MRFGIPDLRIFALALAKHDRIPAGQRRDGRRADAQGAAQSVALPVIAAGQTVDDAPLVQAENDAVGEAVAARVSDLHAVAVDQKIRRLAFRRPCERGVAFESADEIDRIAGHVFDVELDLAGRGPQAVGALDHDARRMRAVGKIISQRKTFSRAEERAELDAVHGQLVRDLSGALPSDHGKRHGIDGDRRFGRRAIGDERDRGGPRPGVYGARGKGVGRNGVRKVARAELRPVRPVDAVDAGLQIGPLRDRARVAAVRPLKRDRRGVVADLGDRMRRRAVHGRVDCRKLGRLAPRADGAVDIVGPDSPVVGGRRKHAGRDDIALHLSRDSAEVRPVRAVRAVLQVRAGLGRDVVLVRVRPAERPGTSRIAKRAVDRGRGRGFQVADKGRNRIDVVLLQVNVVIVPCSDIPLNAAARERASRDRHLLRVVGDLDLVKTSAATLSPVKHGGNLHRIRDAVIAGNGFDNRPCELVIYKPVDKSACVARPLTLVHDDRAAEFDGQHRRRRRAARFEIQV